MIITGWKTRPYSIPLRVPFKTSRGALSLREGIILIASADNGSYGLGEVAPLEGFSRESLAEAQEHSNTLISRLKGIDVPHDFRSLERLMEGLVMSAGIPPSVAFGFETAVADLASRSMNIPTARWIDKGAASKVPVNTIVPAGVDLERLLVKRRSEGFRSFKFKVGLGDVEEDLARIAKARDLLGDSAFIRLDANRAWDFNLAVEVLRRLKAHRVEYVEEPLRPSCLDRIPELSGMSGVDIALDETVSDRPVLDRLIATGAVKAIIIKPSIVGGITRSISLARRVTAMEKDVVITSMMETGVGVSASLHIAAALGPGIPPCGLDTLRCLDETLLEEGLDTENGAIELPSGPGLGITVKGEFLHE